MQYLQQQADEPRAIAAATMGRALSSMLHGGGLAISWLIIVGQRSLLAERHNSMDLHGLQRLHCVLSHANDCSDAHCDVLASYLKTLGAGPLRMSSVAHCKNLKPTFWCIFSLLPGQCWQPCASRAC